MTKRTLHGKRHIRTRRSVVIGRMNRKHRKFMREIRMMSRLIKGLPKFVERIAPTIQAFMDKLVQVVIVIAEVMREQQEQHPEWFTKKEVEEPYELSELKNPH